MLTCEDLLLLQGTLLNLLEHLLVVRVWSVKSQKIQGQITMVSASLVRLKMSQRLLLIFEK